MYAIIRRVEIIDRINDDVFFIHSAKDYKKYI